MAKVDGLANGGTGAGHGGRRRLWAALLSGIATGYAALLGIWFVLG